MEAAKEVTDDPTIIIDAPVEVEGDSEEIEIYDPEEFEPLELLIELTTHPIKYFNEQSLLMKIAIGGKYKHKWGIHIYNLLYSFHFLTPLPSSILPPRSSHRFCSRLVNCFI